MNFIKAEYLFCSRRVQHTAYRLLMYVNVPAFRTSYFVAYTLKYTFLGGAIAVSVFGRDFV
jgi:uncharacterized membrane protein